MSPLHDHSRATRKGFKFGISFWELEKSAYEDLLSMASKLDWIPFTSGLFILLMILETALRWYSCKVV